MKKGDKVRCINSFIANENHCGEYPEKNKIYTISKIDIIKGTLGISLQELFYNITSTGGAWYYDATCFELIDGPDNGEKISNNIPHATECKVREQKPFHMV